MAREILPDRARRRTPHPPLGIFLENQKAGKRSTHPPSEPVASLKDKKIEVFGANLAVPLDLSLFGGTRIHQTTIRGTSVDKGDQGFPL